MATPPSPVLTPDIRIQTRGISDKIMAAKSVVMFTGAGISTESGIPDYRSQGGIWDRFTPVYFDEFMNSEAARVRYWKQRMEMEKGLKHARPNPGHLGIARFTKPDISRRSSPRTLMAFTSLGHSRRPGHRTARQHPAGPVHVLPHHGCLE